MILPGDWSAIPKNVQFAIDHGLWVERFWVLSVGPQRGVVKYAYESKSPAKDEMWHQYGTKRHDTAEIIRMLNRARCVDLEKPELAADWNANL